MMTDQTHATCSSLQLLQLTLSGLQDLPGDAVVPQPARLASPQRSVACSSCYSSLHSICVMLHEAHRTLLSLPRCLDLLHVVAGACPATVVFRMQSVCTQSSACSMSSSRSMLKTMLRMSSCRNPAGTACMARPTTLGPLRAKLRLPPTPEVKKAPLKSPRPCSLRDGPVQPALAARRPAAGPPVLLPCCCMHACMSSHQ